MKNNLWNILKKELREMFRDKKSLSMMLVIPIFVPLIVLGMSALFEVQANKDIEEYNKIGFAYELSEEEKNIAKELNIEVTEGNENELKTKYENDEIDLQPDFQRAADVWNNIKKSRLIESILLGLPLPSFYSPFYVCGEFCPDKIIFTKNKTLRRKIVSAKGDYTYRGTTFIDL